MWELNEMYIHLIITLTVTVSIITVIVFLFWNECDETLKHQKKNRCCVFRRNRRLPSEDYALDTLHDHVHKHSKLRRAAAFVAHFILGREYPRL
jgi:hypothetical protein